MVAARMPPRLRGLVWRPCQTILPAPRQAQGGEFGFLGLGRTTVAPVQRRSVSSATTRIPFPSDGKAAQVRFSEGTRPTWAGVTSNAQPLHLLVSATRLAELFKYSNSAGQRQPRRTHKSRQDPQEQSNPIRVARHYSPRGRATGPGVGFRTAGAGIRSVTG